MYTSDDVDVVLIQHEWAIYETTKLYHFCSQCDKPIIFFAHSPRAELFDELVDGFIVMSNGMLPKAKSPVHLMSHPSWVPESLTERGELKRKFGLEDYDVVIGTNGFLHTDRQFAEITEDILMRKLDLEMSDGRERKWLIDLITSRHTNHEMSMHATSEKELEDLEDLEYWDFRYGNTFLTQEDMNLRMQACDILWCWTKVPSGPYGSGSASDQYGSGTRMVVTNKQQMNHVFGWPNVVVASPDLQGFVQVLVDEVDKGHFPRHDPELIAWESCAGTVVEFMNSLGIGVN